MSFCNYVINSGETSSTRFVKCPQQKVCALLDCTEISFENLGDEVRKFQEDAWELIEKYLLHELEI